MNRLLCLCLGLVLVCAIVLTSCGGSPSANTTSGAKQPTAVPSSNQTSEEPVIVVPTVNKADLPVIQISVSPASVAPGGKATLSWTVTNAKSVSIDHGIGTVPASGTKDVTSAVPTTYKITASNDAGSAIKTVSLAVISSTPAPAPAPTPKPKGK